LGIFWLWLMWDGNWQTGASRSWIDALKYIGEYKMPRKRVIDPEFWSDEEIGNWTHSARLFYIALWNFADDEGKFKAHTSLLKAQIFPYDKKNHIENIKTEISSKVIWYEVENAQYGYLKNFLKNQRIDKPQPSKLPVIPRSFLESSKNDLGTVPPNIREEKLREVKRSKEKVASDKSSATDHFFNSLTDQEKVKGNKIWETVKNCEVIKIEPDPKSRKIVIDWIRTFPNTFISQEIKKAENWLVANKKHKVNYIKFINNWLNRADRG